MRFKWILTIMLLTAVDGLDRVQKKRSTRQLGGSYKQQYIPFGYNPFAPKPPFPMYTPPTPYGYAPPAPPSPYGFPAPPAPSPYGYPPAPPPSPYAFPAPPTPFGFPQPPPMMYGKKKK